VFFFPKHFHGRGFNFHLINGRFYTGKVIKVVFAYTLHPLCMASGGIDCIFNFNHGKLQI
ncbi:MAG: hypothetical protein ACOH2V_12855, partial [Candidatus Saccharimonadaceae bacterium]